MVVIVAAAFNIIALVSAGIVDPRFVYDDPTVRPMGPARAGRVGRSRLQQTAWAGQFLSLSATVDTGEIPSELVPPTSSLVSETLIGRVVERLIRRILSVTLVAATVQSSKALAVMFHGVGLGVFGTYMPSLRHRKRLCVLLGAAAVGLPTFGIFGIFQLSGHIQLWLSLKQEAIANCSQILHDAKTGSGRKALSFKQIKARLCDVESESESGWY